MGYPQFSVTRGQAEAQSLRHVVRRNSADPSDWDVVSSHTTPHAAYARCAEEQAASLFMKLIDIPETLQPDVKGWLDKLITNASTLNQRHTAGWWRHELALHIDSTYALFHRRVVAGRYLLPFMINPATFKRTPTTTAL